MMQITESDKFYIAAKASFILERLDGSVLPGAPDDSDALKNMERWKRLLDGKDTEDSFERRIKLLGMAQEEILPYLGDVSWNPERPLPPWIRTLEGVFNLLPSDIDSLKKELPVNLFNDSKPVPFEEFWLPWLCYALKKMREVNPDLDNYFSSNALGDWLSGVLDTFKKRLSLPLLSAFDMERSGFSFFMPGNAAMNAAPGSRKSYLDFIGKALSGPGLLDFAKKYSVAVRLASVILENSLSYFNSVMESLRADMKDIADSFNGGKSPGLVTGLKSNLSDPHNRDCAVIEFSFESGLKLVYKPRSFDLDKRWEAFLSWCTMLCPSIDFRFPHHVGNGSHVWVGHLENSPLARLEDAANFYRRCGALLAAAYTLNGYDFHQENLMAWGAYPVLIDLETVLRPLVKPFNYEEMDSDFKKKMLSLEGDSVLRTSFLPMWIPAGKDVVRDYGALTPDDNINYTVTEWVEVNTDRMRREFTERRTEPSPNVPHFDGKLMDVTNYIDELCDGFTKFYTLFMEHHKDLPLDIFEGAMIRYLPRNSQVYGDMIYRLYSPGLLRSGAAFSVELEGMGQPFLHGVPDSKLADIWKIFELERSSLEILNIPLFEAHSGSQAVFDNSKPVLGDYYLLSAIDEIKRRLDHLSAKDLDFQKQLITASLACRYPKSESDSDDEAEKILASSISDPMLSDNEFIRAAADVAAEIAERVVRHDKNPQWLTQKFDPVTHFLNIGPVDPMLYEGSAGIGLFLSAYTYVSGDDKYRALALECFNDFKELFEDKNASIIAKWFSLGYGSGISGALWAAFLSSRFLGGCAELDSIIKKAFDIFSGEAILNDQGNDVIAGSAGALPVLLEFYKYSGEKRFLDWATLCGEHMLEKRIEFEGTKLWASNFAYRPLCGFGHGQAGYAYALLKLYGETKLECFREAAGTALAYENSSYFEKYHNWPDFRINKKLKDGEIAFMAGWCSGAPGIGLGRLMALDVMDDPQTRADIENSLLQTNEFVFRPYSPDHLCCGFAGRADFLIEAALRLKRPELMDEARRQMSFVVNRMRRRGYYTLSGGGQSAVFTPGFFSGISGIAYTALRLANPEKLPTLLIPSTKSLY